MLNYVPERCGHQMRNESENGGHGRESNPTSSAIAAAALTSELQAIPMVLLKLEFHFDSTKNTSADLTFVS